MDREQFNAFLTGATLLCAAMALISFARYRARGRSALALGGAFLALAVTLWLIVTGLPTGVIVAGFIAVFLLLALDFALRASKPDGGDS